MQHPPQTSELDARPIWLRPLFATVVAVALLAIAAYALVVLQNANVRDYETTIETHQLELKGYDIMAAGWRAGIAHITPPEAAPDPQAARVEAAASVEFLAGVIADYDANWAGRGPANVSSKLSQYADLHRRELELLREGRAGEAMGVLVGALAVFEELRGEARTATVAALRDARQTHDYIQAASVGALVFGFVAIGVLALLYRRADRRAIESYAEQEVLRRSEARFRPLIESASDIIAVTSPEGTIKYVSPSVSAMSGMNAEAFIGKSMQEFVQDADARQIMGLMNEVSSRPGITRSAEVRTHARQDPSVARYLHIICTNRLDDAEINGLVFTIRDISDRRELEDQLRHQAFHDALTGLANRLLFTDRLEHALERGKRNGGKFLSVLYVDLDFFKNVNDNMGHSAGDDLLSQVATRIRACIRSTDTAARLGGDEFAILLEDQHTEDEAQVVAEHILTKLNQSFHVNDREVHVSASIGLVVANPHQKTAEDIIRDADVAMYDAKENGRGRVQVFEESMQLSLADRVALSDDLNCSAERGELEVYYQPTLNLETQRIAGFEALVRWNHPQRGLLLPGQFVQLAEEFGFIHDLGYFVLAETCRQGLEWQKAYPEQMPFAMSVNVSARQLQRPEFVSQVKQVLEDTGFDPASLVLEITESVLVRHPLEVIATLVGLKGLGLQLALDDFGTGYSSLSYLKRFPIDILKIDRSFIESMDESDRDRMLVQTVIDLGRTLKLDIVAEGIERTTQLKGLQKLHCAFGQGFLFSKALGASAAEAMLRNQAAGRTLPSTDREGLERNRRVA